MGIPGPISLSLHLEHLLIRISTFMSGHNSNVTELKLAVNVTEWSICWVRFTQLYSPVSFTHLWDQNRKNTRWHNSSPSLEHHGSLIILIHPQAVNISPSPNSNRAEICRNVPRKFHSKHVKLNFKLFFEKLKINFYPPKRPKMKKRRVQCFLELLKTKRLAFWKNFFFDFFSEFFFWGGGPKIY